MKRTLIATIAAALAVAAVGAAATPAVHITIRHQLHHCHAWSVGGGAYKAALSVKVARGGSIVFTDNDVMSHKLIQQGGPKVTLGAKATMSKMGATFRLTFAKAGTYTFSTAAGEDYMKGVKTIGEDNVLKLTVKVS